jgi:hypothetical protein
MHFDGFIFKNLHKYDLNKFFLPPINHSFVFHHQSGILFFQTSQTSHLSHPTELKHAGQEQVYEAEANQGVHP